MNVLVLSRRVLLLVTMCGLAAMTTCARNQPTVPASGSSAGLGFRLLIQLTADSAYKNVVISPMGVEMCLAMALNGAGGRTQAEIAEALGVSVAELEQINSRSAATLRLLSRRSSGVHLSVTNALWAGKDVDLRRQFADQCRRYYSANVGKFDMADPGAPKRLNQWVARATHGLVPTVVDKLDPLTVALLVNVVYFHGKWAVPFSPKYTKLGEFRLMDGKRVQKMMMHHLEEFPCLATDSFAAVALPFAGRRFLLYVFVPDDTLGLPRFLEKLNPDNWNRWLAEFQTTEVSVCLPRFTVRYEADLKSTLAALGMSSAFDSASADFTPMVAKSPVPVWLGSAQHKAVLEVNEAGARAASVKALGAVGGCPEAVYADRPFFVALVDDWTKAVLFAGAIYDPVE